MDELFGQGAKFVFALESSSFCYLGAHTISAMGVSLPVSAHAGPSAQTPIDTSGNFPACVSTEFAFKHLPQALISHTRRFRPL